MPGLLTSPEDITKLAACFTVRINSSSKKQKDMKHGMKKKITDLPQHLRRYSPANHLFHKAKIKKDERESNPNRSLCSAHMDISSLATSEIFKSLTKELYFALESMWAHITVFGPDETVTLRRVAGVQQMWAKRWPAIQNRDQWEYQFDQCEACMLSRIATCPSTLRELRTVLLAHLTRTPSRPLILTFVDEWIMLTGEARILFDTSEQRAEEIKDCLDPMRIHNRVKAAEKKDEEEMKKKNMASKQQLRDANGFEILPALSYNPTSPLKSAKSSPLLSSTLTRPLSRNEYEFSEAEFLHEFSPNRTFFRASSNASISDFTDMYSEENNTGDSLGLSKTIAALQKQQILDQYRATEGGRRRGEAENLEIGLTSRLYGPWSPTDEVRGSYSRFSETTASSRSPSVYPQQEYSSPISPIDEPNHWIPDRFTTPVSPLHSPGTPERYIPPPKTPKTPERSRPLLTIPEVSPFDLSPSGFVASASRGTRPFSSRKYSSAMFPESSTLSISTAGEEVLGTPLTMSRAQPRVVDSRAARNGEVPN